MLSAKGAKTVNRNKSISLKEVNNKKGVTLVELLVSMAILSVVVMPLLASYLTSVRNNFKSEQLLVASNIALKAMEEIKADSSRLKGIPEWTAFISNLNAPPWTANPKIGNYNIEYKISETLQYQDINNFDPPKQSEFDIFIDVFHDSMNIGTSSYPLTDDDGNIQHNLSLETSGALFSYSVNSGTSVSFVPGEISIDIGVDFTNRTEPGEAFLFDIVSAEEISLPINLYVLDDTWYELMLSTSGNDFNTFRSLDVDRAIPDFTSRLYRIDIRVKYKDGEILNTISSMVKK